MIHKPHVIQLAAANFITARIASSLKLGSLLGMPEIPRVERLRKEEQHQFKGNLGYLLSLRPVWTT